MMPTHSIGHSKLDKRPGICALCGSPAQGFAYTPRDPFCKKTYGACSVEHVKKLTQFHAEGLKMPKAVVNDDSVAAAHGAAGSFIKMQASSDLRLWSKVQQLEFVRFICREYLNNEVEKVNGGEK